MFDLLNYDVRYALRGLLRDKAFTAVALLSIGLGVGANAAIYSLVDQALYRQLPVKDPERLVLLSWNGPSLGSTWGSGNLLSNPLFRDLKAENQVFDGIFARHPTSVHLMIDRTAEPANADIVSGSYFPTLGVRPALGRLIDETDDVRPGAHPVIVLSYDFWKSRLAAAPDVVGRKFLMNNFPMTVIGVAAPGFRGVDWGEVPSIYVPTMMKKQATPDFDWLDDRRGNFLHVFGRLKPGISQRQAQVGLEPWFKAMLQADMGREGFPKVTAEQREQYLASKLDVLPAASGRSDLRSQIEKPLLVLLAATVLVLLLACLNVANLCLARAFARRRDTALRLAVGASRERIVRELLSQSALLALAGAGAGLALAPIVSSGLISFLPDAVDLSAAVNPRVFLFALLVALGTGLLFGIAPALQASRAQPGFTLKEDGRGVAGGLGLRRALVVGQIALALVLLVGAGLFVRTLSNLRTQGPGFDTTNLLAFRVDPNRAGYTEARARTAMRALLAALRGVPEVQSAGLSGAYLLNGASWSTDFTIDTGDRIPTTQPVHCNDVSEGFFESLGARLLSGRRFEERDQSDDPDPKFRSAIVNESFAKRYFGDKSPLGARLGFGVQPDAKTDVEIVGVVQSFSYRSLRENDDQAFFPFFEGSGSGGGFYVRTRSSSAAAFASIRAAVRQVDPALPVESLRTVDDQLDRSLSNERLLALLATAFAALAVLLAVVGLYGVTSFVVTSRTREIGVRIALGATRFSTLALIVRDTATMVLAGVAIALPAMFGLGRLIESQLFGVAAMDARTVASCAVLIAVVALSAAAWPARRAASLNPVEALRCE